MSSYDLDLIIKIFLAAIFGIIIGLDRQLNNKPAGTRTQMLLCVGSALLAGISIHIADKYALPGATMHPDPARLMAQVIAGIGFLGAGVILKDGNRISGVTTAATIWITASVGIAIGSGFYAAAGVCTFFVLLLHPLARIEYKLGLKKFTYILRIPRNNWSSIITIFNENNVKYTIDQEKQKTIQFIVFSSGSKKKKIVKKLHKKNINFEILDKK